MNFRSANWLSES